MEGRARYSVRRRGFLIGAAGIGAACLLPMYLREAPPRIAKRGTVGDIGGAAVPSMRLSLADFGGVPGAGRDVLVSAFNRVLTALDKRGGGILFVPPGVYDFGGYADPAYILLCRNVRNVAISAYGATFIATTSANVVTNMFYFFNFHNVTIAGANFLDRGFNPWFDWKGMVCVGIQADQASSGLNMVDCYAESVVGLLTTNNDAASQRHLSDVTVQGEVRNSYYGVGASFIMKNVNVELVCHNIRRAFIACSLRKAKIAIRASNTLAWPGSNGLVSLATNGASTGNVENVRVHVDVAGDCIHSSYVHFYHQGPEVEGYIRDVDATVNVTDSNSTGTLFLFDHEVDGVQRRTGRTWDRISLHGSVPKGFAGKIISNPSVTTAPGRIHLDRHLARVGVAGPIVIQ